MTDYGKKGGDGASLRGSLKSPSQTDRRVCAHKHRRIIPPLDTKKVTAFGKKKKRLKKRKAPLCTQKEQIEGKEGVSDVTLGGL